MDPKSPTGIKVPGADAIAALNQSAQSVAKRSQIALMTQQQSHVGRDALRRDYVQRKPTAESYANTESVPIPADQAPPAFDSPFDKLKDLIDQFKGVGDGGGSGGTGGGPPPRSVTRNPIGGGGSSPAPIPTRTTGGSGSGVQTFTRDGGRDTGRPVSVPVRTFTRDGPEGGVEGGGVRESPSSEVTTFRNGGGSGSGVTTSRSRQSNDPNNPWQNTMNINPENPWAADPDWEAQRGSNGMWEVRRRK